MDKKDRNSSSRHMCNRIKNAAVSACPSFKAICRVRHRQSSPSPALETSQTKSTPYVRNNKIIEVHPRPDPDPSKLAKPGLDSRHQKGDVVAIHLDFEKPKPSPHVVKVGSNVGLKDKANPEVESHKKTGVHIEDRFSDYINRARKIFRTSTFVAAYHGKGAKDQNDHEVSSKESSAEKDHKFNDFIDRAKKKFRTTSSIGGGRSISFK